jgi:hypothetical protein
MREQASAVDVEAGVVADREGPILQRDGNCAVFEVAADHAAAVAMWVGKTSTIGGETVGLQRAMA